MVSNCNARKNGFLFQLDRNVFNMIIFFWWITVLFPHHSNSKSTIHWKFIQICHKGHDFKEWSLFFFRWHYSIYSHIFIKRDLSKILHVIILKSSFAIWPLQTLTKRWRIITKNHLFVSQEQNIEKLVGKELLKYVFYHNKW